MNTLKKLICILTIALTGITLISSCSKEPQTGASKKGKKAPIAAKAESIPLDKEKNTLTAVRNGQYVDLSWHVDVSADKIDQIHIFRNTTGKGSKRRVAVLNPGATDYKDCLSDGGAQWYWLKIIAKDGKNFDLGPVRVADDPAGSGHYVDPEDKFKVVITRTDDIATLEWDFPKDDYKRIYIIRHTRPVSEPSLGDTSRRRKAVMEWKGKYSDALPDANEDYWYWFQITMKSGAIIYKGPIKAEYNAQSQSKAR